MEGNDGYDGGKTETKKSRHLRHGYCSGGQVLAEMRKRHHKSWDVETMMQKKKRTDSSNYDSSKTVSSGITGPREVPSPFQYLKEWQLKRRHPKTKTLEKVKEQYSCWKKTITMFKKHVREGNLEINRKSKDVVRYDEDINKSVRSVAWSEDYMTNYIQNKQIRMKLSLKLQNRPSCNGSPLIPNRFEIEPGYRWDGVDRPVVFERKQFKQGDMKKRFCKGVIQVEN